MDNELTQRGIFLDDERSIESVTWIELPTDVEWTIIRTFDGMLEVINDNTWTMYDVITFDHDLNQTSHSTYDEPDGYTLIKLLIDQAIDLGVQLPVCYFHTMNHIGKVNMQSYYNNYLKQIHDNSV